MLILRDIQRDDNRPAKCNIYLNQPTKSNLNLREDPKHGVFVDGLTQEIVSNFREALSVFSKGETLRTTAETKFNERSSRSHAIFSIIIVHNYIPDVIYISAG